ncbi:hypothetical protein F511_32005 [Dorcoceras hygrometricum]|uniref:Uncharacterized protein n=1 Tax=Dorcoceras hygrometricum TaxID=472368 RepID=A0A2Z7D726_9LAMI|nr:hypothetical protein F511_32005 [Dorcoceras hygrometricum]
MSSPDSSVVRKVAESIDSPSPTETRYREDEIPSSIDLQKARLLRIDRDVARLAAQGRTWRQDDQSRDDESSEGEEANPEVASSSRSSGKEKRKTPLEGREKRKKHHHEEGATDTTRTTILKEPINVSVDTTNKGPEQQSTEVPYVLLDTSAISFVAQPSGSTSLEFIRRLVHEQDFDLLGQLHDQLSNLGNLDNTQTNQHQLQRDMGSKSNCALCVCVSCCKQGSKRCRFERWSDVALLEISLTLTLPPALSPAEIVLPVKIWNHNFTAHMANQIKRHNVSSVTYENFPGGLSIDTSLETGVAGFEEREVAVVLECLCDCGPAVLLFFNSLG